jgi:hypothetical protein
MQVADVSYTYTYSYIHICCSRRRASKLNTKQLVNTDPRSTTASNASNAASKAGS